MDFFINNFVSQINSTKESILNLQSSQGYNVDNFKITLLYSLLNYMANFTISHQKNVKGKIIKLNDNEKVTSFIMRFCDFKEGYKVSIPQLKLYLNSKKNMSSADMDLEEYVDNILEEWYKRQYDATGRILSPILITEDIELSDLTTMFDVHDEKLEQLTHVKLLYAQRNSLVHTTRKKGTAFNIANLYVPHYEYQTLELSSKNYVDSFTKSLELCYPLEFYINLVNTAIEKLPAFFKKHQINPIKYIELMGDWFSKPPILVLDEEEESCQ